MSVTTSHVTQVTSSSSRYEIITDRHTWISLLILFRDWDTCVDLLTLPPYNHWRQYSQWWPASFRDTMTPGIVTWRLESGMTSCHPDIKCGKTFSFIRNKVGTHGWQNWGKHGTRRWQKYLKCSPNWQRLGLGITNTQHVFSIKTFICFCCLCWLNISRNTPGKFSLLLTGSELFYSNHRWRWLWGSLLSPSLLLGHSKLGGTSSLLT